MQLYLGSSRRGGIFRDEPKECLHRRRLYFDLPHSIPASSHCLIRHKSYASGQNFEILEIADTLSKTFRLKPVQKRRVSVHANTLLPIVQFLREKY